MNMTLERFKKDAREGAVSCNKDDVMKICEELFSYSLSYFEEHEEDIQEIFETLYNDDLLYRDAEERSRYEVNFALYPSIFPEEFGSFILEAIRDTDLGRIILLFYEQNEKRTKEQEENLNSIRGYFEKIFLGRLHLDY